jgi:lysophospholipase L1-like esterase
VKRALLGLAAVVLVLGGAAGYRLWGEISRSISEDPLVWEETIAAFEREDREHPPPEAPILFVGSSSIRLWDSLAEDMAPIVTLNRGFGGSKVGDVLHYADRIITRYRPRVVVIYVGSNDLGAALGNVPKTPEAVLELTRQLAARLRKAQPLVRIYWLATKPTTTDPTRWERGQVLNRRVVQWASGEFGVRYLDANKGLLDEQGGADPSFLRFDGIHLNEAGYAVWGATIRERLLADLGYNAR